MNVKWETPPSIRRTSRVSDDELDLATQLRSHPDTWARGWDFRGDDQKKAGQLAVMIRSGKRAAFRADRVVDGGEFDAVSRKDPHDPNVTAVYVRFVTQTNND